MSRRLVLAVLAVATVVTSAPAQRRAWGWLELQREDGSWSAADSGGERRGDVRASALMVTSLLAFGPLEQIDQQHALLRGLRWLTLAMDERGRIGFSPEPHWLLDHAIATHALLEALRLEQRKTDGARDTAVRAWRALERGVTETTTLSMELRLWTHMCQRVARSLAIDCADLSALHWRAEQPPTASETLAEALHEMLVDGRSMSDEALFAHVPKVALEDPLATVYATFLAFQQGGGTWRRMSDVAATEVVKRQIRVRDAGQWDWEAKGAFAAVHGAAGTTACALLVVCTYYRFNRLLVCE